MDKYKTVTLYVNDQVAGVSSSYFKALNIDSKAIQTNNPLQIGYYSDSNGNEQYFDGFIKNLKLNKKKILL